MRFIYECSSLTSEATLTNNTGFKQERQTPVSFYVKKKLSCTIFQGALISLLF